MENETEKLLPVGSDAIVVPLPCPFCGDPMRINNAKLITHSARPSSCVIADLVWDESAVEILRCMMRVDSSLLNAKAHTPAPTETL